MASDTLEGMGPPHVSREEADRVFGALPEGGTVTLPLADQCWGDNYGSLTDRVRGPVDGELLARAGGSRRAA